MKKVLLIGFKDLKLAFRDPAALIMMLAAPFVMAAVLGFITGRFGSSTSSGVSQIEVVVANQDGGELGKALADLLGSDQLGDLIKATTVSDPKEARRLVDGDKAAAAVIIPAGFTSSILPEGIPPGSGNPAAPAVAQIELYANPTRQINYGVVRAIVDEFLARVEIGRVGGEVTVTQLIANQLIRPEQALEIGVQLGKAQAVSTPAGGAAIRLNKTAASSTTNEFDLLAYLAPGFAMIFLMFTMTYGGRSILVERNQGTLPRLLASPTSMAQVLGGKVLGIYLTGVAQMLILVGSDTLLFGLDWGDPFGLVVLILAIVFGATAWGMLIATLSRTPGQASSIGTAIMLIFGLLGGSFISLESMPAAIRLLSKITPNAWGLDGFVTLSLGGSLIDLGAPLLGLAVMGIVLFLAAVLLFNRQNILQR